VGFSEEYRNFFGGTQEGLHTKEYITEIAERLQRAKLNAIGAPPEVRKLKIEQALEIIKNDLSSGSIPY
jgi:hypothetical protein